jgi:hypothetical protein
MIPGSGLRISGRFGRLAISDDGVSARESSEAELGPQAYSRFSAEQTMKQVWPRNGRKGGTNIDLCPKDDL